MDTSAQTIAIAIGKGAGTTAAALANLSPTAKVLLLIFSLARLLPSSGDSSSSEFSARETMTPDRDVAVAKLSAFTVQDGTFVEDSNDDQFIMASPSGEHAMRRTSEIVRGALDGTNIDSATVSLSMGLGWL